MGRVVVSGAPGDYGGRIVEQVPNDFGRLWRCCDNDVRIPAEPHPKHQHVPGLRIAPGGELVAPCRVVLRTAQAFRLIGRIGGGHRTVGPRQPALAGLVKRARIRRNGQNAGCALNHNIARVGRSRPHQGDSAPPRLDRRFCGGLLGFRVRRGD